MPSDWSATTLGDCAEFFSGGTPRKSNEAYWGGMVPWFSGKDLKSFYLSDSEDHVTEDGAEAGSRLVPPGTILLLVRGMTLHNDVPIGVLTREATFNQDIKAIRARSGVQQSFLAHWLVSQKPRLLSTVHAAGHGTGVLATDRLQAMELELPPPDEQAAIAEVFDLIEDKIEQNRRTGRALEELARAMFNAWFVDFEPVKAKAAGAAGFPGMPPATFAVLPDRLINSLLGLVPQGWDVSNVGTVAQRIAMGPFGSDIKTDNFVSDGVPVIRGGNLADGFVDRDFVFLTEAKADQLANANAFPGDIVITHRGTLGQIGLIPRASRYKRYVVSQSQMLIRPNAAMLPSHFLYLFLTSSAGQHELLANRSQTGVPAISRPTTSVKAISLVLPQRPVVDAFEGLASTLFNARVATEDESHKLAALRDYLLPRLLSGRVRVGPPPGDEG